jgi:anthranilate phosphoribosyltransferase
VTETGSGLKRWLGDLADNRHLDESDAKAAFDVIMDGQATPAQVGAFLMALRQRGETVPEIVGAARAMRARMLPIRAPDGAIDTCGTGGDGSGSFNISTASAFVTAACGVPVAKHGNRNLSSKSGSADVLSALGIDIDAPFDRIERALREVGIGFLMAPRHHAAMGHVAPVRVELGIRTLFNLLGPLANPAGVRRQVVGVFAAKWVEPLAHVLQRLGSEACWVVHGDGMDELTTTGTTEIAILAHGKVTRMSLEPEQIGLKRATRADLAGGSPQENAAMLKIVLGGKMGPLRDVVLLNSAAALMVATRVSSLPEGMALAAGAIDSGMALRLVDRLAEITRTAI